VPGQALSATIAQDFHEGFRDAALEIVFLVDLRQARAVVEEHVDLATRTVTAAVRGRFLVQIDLEGIDATPQRLGEPFGFVMDGHPQVV
jgi:hypothetical protein